MNNNDMISEHLNEIYVKSNVKNIEQPLKYNKNQHNKIMFLNN